MQSIKALLYFRGYSRLLHTKGLFYPIVVYKGPGKIIDQNKNELENFLYYRSYVWKEPHTQDRPETRQIYADVVHESNLETYLEKIYKTEMNNLMNHVFFENKMQKNKRKDKINPGL